jgi:hypothetical protein
VLRNPSEDELARVFTELAMGEDQDNQFRWRDPAGVLQQVRLDRRVLFVAMLTTGSASFQISRDSWKAQKREQGGAIVGLRQHRKGARP